MSPHTTHKQAFEHATIRSWQLGRGHGMPVAMHLVCWIMGYSVWVTAVMFVRRCEANRT